MIFLQVPQQPLRYGNKYQMSKEINLNKSALWFGYCGLIPFLLPSILIWVIGTGVPIDPLYLFFCTYSLLIGCFLTGTIWSFSIYENLSPLGPIVLFLVLFLLSFLLMALFYPVTLSVINVYAIEESVLLLLLISLMLFYWALFAFESKTYNYNQNYRNMRLRLTFFVFIAHLSWVVFYIEKLF